MLQAHSFLWNYLWVAPNVLLLTLAIVLASRGQGRQFLSFTVFAIVSSIGEISVFLADIAPSVSAENFWRIDWANLLIATLLKFILIGEAFSHVLSRYPSISRLGRILISGFGAILVFAASLMAAFSRGDSTQRLISGFHLLQQTVFIIALGLILFLFLFAAYFRLSWDRLSFGVLLGFGISACVHLSTWAIVANGSPSSVERTYIDFLNMATYHFCVLIWFYYVLVPGKVVQRSTVALPDNNLAVWNRELERLLQP
jgi:hypothetical protein